MKQGFSLVELSIVLVILGLLTGGILGGQSLIRAAELRSVSTEYQRYVTAVNTFRDKYFQIPGDFRDATRFWGRANTNADCVTNSSAAVNSTTGTCDGDGNGYTPWNGTATVSAENLQFWRQLALAGLIEGSYTGLVGATNFSYTTGTVIPASKLASSAWWVNNTTQGNLDPGDTTTLYAAYYGNYFTVGAQMSGSWPATPIFKPEEAWNIDTKMDDGKPGTGKIIARNRTTCANSSSATDYASDYRLNDTTTSCLLYFTRAY
jgi:prepilin-type N-terminal cleavage/methylation domain-containing protein